MINNWIISLVDSIRIGFNQKLDLLKAGNNIFDYYYQNNTWGDSESVSGPGSTLAYTANIRTKIPELVEELGVFIILDSPCGDFNWFRAIEWNRAISYIGADIVKPLIDKNRLLYGDASKRFISLDITNDKLPQADLWLCRDCLFHLSYKDIAIAIQNFLTSDIRYILTSNHQNCTKNKDITTGSFRLLNLELPPFNLGKPIMVIDDWIEGFPERQLCLWERNTLINKLGSDKIFQELLESIN
jgi:hypothetical protein